MAFSSLTFLCLFLTVVTVLYFLFPGRKARNWILLAASLIFYSWGEPKYIVLVVLVSLVAYFGGISMENSVKQGKTAAKHAAFWVSVSLIIVNLLVFKYLNFFCDNINALFRADIRIGKIALPIGISFYTFQILSYLFDLNSGKVKAQRNFLYLLLYVSFFPQLMAGPIVRYSAFETQILDRHESWEDIVCGLKRFIVGLAKKVILADGVAAVANLIYGGNAAVYGTLMYWLAALSYTFEIYFDFSGYSDMALGLDRIFGFHFPENFNYPYLSTSITEFWRRWHISLSSWFRDYVYIPLGGNRVKKSRWVLNILVVWALTGFWHGAKWNFIFWGLYYAALLLLEKLVLKRWFQKWPAAVRWFYTFFFVMVGWVLFNLTDAAQLSTALRMMFTWNPTDWTGVIAADAGILYALIYLPLAFLFSFPTLKKLEKRGGRVGVLVQDAVYALLFLVSVTSVISSKYTPFIYFRF